MSIPKDLSYTSHDEWVRVEGDVATVGITEFAQDQLGEIVHIELPEEGAEFEAGAEVCEVESVKAVAEIYAPAAGKVVAVNEDLEDEPEGINEDPYGSWMFKLELSSGLDGADLMDAAAYEAKIND